MAVRLWFAVPALALTGALAAQTIDSRLSAQAPAPAQDASTLDDQTELALTVYNSDLALVRDVRTLRLPRGVSDLRFMDVAVGALTAITSTGCGNGTGAHVLPPSVERSSRPCGTIRQRTSGSGEMTSATAAWR